MMIGKLLNDRYQNDRYQIESEIGRGGMGVVYKANDTLLDSAVVVKMVTLADLGSEGRDRLLQEARAAARLNYLSRLPNWTAWCAAGWSVFVPLMVRIDLRLSRSQTMPAGAVYDKNKRSQ